MKRIEIKDQLRHRIALELADRQMAEADRQYAAVKGKMKNAFIDAESALWDRFGGKLPGNGGDLMKRYAVCAFLGALLWFPIILGGVIYA